MQSRSRLWKELAASGSARLETVIAIEGQEYTPASVVTVDRAAMSTALSAGACITATVRFSLRPVSGAEIPRTAAVVVRCRFSDRERYSEWHSMGTFYVSRRQSNPVNGVLEFQGFDAMAKSDAPFSLLSGYPRSMRSVVMDIAHSMEIEIDARTWGVLLTGFRYSVQLPSENAKMIDVLGYIGGTCGGNWIITPENKLRLVPLLSSSGAAAALDRVEIRGITGQIRTGEALTVTGVSSSFGSKTFFAGDDTGGIISVPANPYMHNSIAAKILTTYDGLVYTPYEIKDGIYDPALEIGDYLISRSDVQGVVWRESANYKPAFRGDLSAPFPKETGDTERSLSDVGGESSGVHEELSVRFYKFVSRADITISDGQSAEIINFDYAAGAGQDVVFHAEIKHTTVTIETGGDSAGWTVGDAVITATYYINGRTVTDYQPAKTETDGVNLLHLNYHFENGEFTTGNFQAVISVSGGSISIAAGEALAYIIGQGYTAPVGEWVTEDGLLFIGVESYPAKMEYQSGEALDYTGLIVKAYYADGTERDVTQDCTISPAAGETVGNVQSVTVQIFYTEDEKEYRDSFDVWVIIKELLYLDVRTLPAKTEYEAGETLDYTGLSIAAVYSDGTEKDVTAECVFDPAEGVEYVETNSPVVKVSYARYGEKAETFFEAYAFLKYLAITSYPAKMRYAIGDQIDYTGLEITGHYSSGAVKDFTAQITLDPPSGYLVQSTGKIVAEWYYKGQLWGQFEMTAVISVLKSIEVRRLPDKIFYLPGETLNYTGLSVIAIYSDEIEKDVTADCVFAPADGAEIETKIDRIEVRNLPDKMIYLSGEALDYTGVSVVAVMSDGTERDVTHECVFDPANETIVSV